MRMIVRKERENASEFWLAQSDTGCYHKITYEDRKRQGEDDPQDRDPKSLPAKPTLVAAIVTREATPVCKCILCTRRFLAYQLTI